MRKAMESRDAEALHTVLKNLLERLRFTPVADCRSACIDFLYQVVSCLRNSGRSIPQHLETVDKMAAYIGRIGSFQKLSREMKDSLDTLYRLSVAELDAYRSVVYKMKIAIDRNFPMALDLGFFAQSLHLSYSYLSTLFKNEIGMTFKEYLNVVRIRNACELLKKKNCLVGEVAELVGYSNPYYFSKVFKKSTGYSPAEYRKRFFMASIQEE